VRHAAGSDPAAVVFDAVQAARARAIDHLIVDTAGRLHNKEQLMAELVYRSVSREPTTSSQGVQ
jgi:fused signal recognition particle receptor